jgi:mannose-6-phosphate isomerase
MPVVELFQPRYLGPKPWGTELLIAETQDYIGKVMHMYAGNGGPLQYHERKDETFYLLSGRAVVSYRDQDNQPKSFTLGPGMSVHMPPGAVHSVHAVTDCVIVEASTPVFEDRVAVEGVPV